MPASTARARRCGSASCSGKIGFGSRFGIGEPGSPEDVREDRFGLVGIRQRARLLGGKCSIRSKIGKGTRIAVELPVVFEGLNRPASVPTIHGEGFLGAVSAGHNMLDGGQMPYRGSLRT